MTIRLEWHCTTWLIASLSYTSPFITTRLWSSNGRWWRTEESVVLKSTGSQSVEHNIVTEEKEQEESWARRRVLTCDRQEQGVAGVWPRIGRVSEGAIAPVGPAVGWGPRRGNSAWCALQGPLPWASGCPRFSPSLSRCNWSKASSELQSNVTFSPDLTTGPPWAEREGFLYRPWRKTLILEHWVTLVLNSGLKPEVCNERNTAMRRPPTAMRESPTARNTQYRGKFKLNFNNGVSLNILF